MISQRIEEIVKRVPKCGTVIDVGCDHGKVSYLLRSRSIAEKAIMTDISRPSLKKAEDLMKSIYPNSEFYFADGIPKNVKFDFAVIAGMGGLEIEKIVLNGNVENALVQPMNNTVKLRESLVKSGRKILSDEIIFDGKFYNVIVFTVGLDSLTTREKLFGRTNLQSVNEVFIKYLNTEKKKTEKIIKGIEDGKERKDELTEYLKELTEIIDEIQRNNI